MNMPATAEYGTKLFGANKSTVTVLHAAPSRNIARRVIRFEHISAGYQIAGSCGAWVDECYAVRFDEGGCIHGRRFASETDAVKTYLAWIDPA